MKAVLLAAGLGTRLKPVTDFVPKCLVPIDGVPLLEYWLRHLNAIGISHCIINTHYKASMVEDYIASCRWKDSVKLLHEEELHLTGGTLLACKDYLGDQPFMVIHADNLSFCDFTAFIEAHNTRPKECEITMMTFEVDSPKNCGIVVTDEMGIVVEFHEKVIEPPGNIANAAVYILEPSVLYFLESLGKDKIDLSTEVLPHFLGKIFTFHNSLYHRDIGTLESYAMAQIEIKSFIQNC